VYLIRARRIWVAVLPDQGLSLSGRLIPWDDIRSVVRIRPRFRDKSGPTEVSSFAPDAVPDVGGCGEGCVTGAGELLALIGIVIAALFALWVLIAVVIPLLVIPVLEVFAPFGDRITVITRRGRFVLRDLRDADEFVRRVQQRKPVTVR
jgi:hypothetical protein